VEKNGLVRRHLTGNSNRADTSSSREIFASRAQERDYADNANDPDISGQTIQSVQFGYQASEHDKALHATENNDELFNHSYTCSDQINAASKELIKATGTFYDALTEQDQAAVENSDAVPVKNFSFKETVPESNDMSSSFNSITDLRHTLPIDTVTDTNLNSLTSHKAERCQRTRTDDPTLERATTHRSGSRNSSPEQIRGYSTTVREPHKPNKQRSNATEKNKGDTGHQCAINTHRKANIAQKERCTEDVQKKRTQVGGSKAARKQRAEKRSTETQGPNGHQSQGVKSQQPNSGQESKLKHFPGGRSTRHVLT